MTDKSEIQILKPDFSVCKVTDFSLVNLDCEYCFTAKTDEENSLVCPTKYLPANVESRSDGWKGFRICGVLDFSLIGILSDIASRLSENGISIFAVSTYNTDYVFTKSDVFEKAVALLKNGGYSVKGEDMTA